MTKFAIKTQDGKYLKMPPAAIEVNKEVLRIGAEIKSTPYNYKTETAANEALLMIQQYLARNNPSAAHRASNPKDWRYYKYIDRQVGCYIEQIG